MFANNQNFAEQGKKQFDQAVRLSNIMMASAERFANLQMDLSKKLLADQAQAAKALTEIKDPKSLVEFQASQTQPSIDQAFSLARSVYDAAAQTQSDVQSFVEEQMLAFNKQLYANLDTLAKNAPAGSDVAVNAVKNVLTSATAAYDSVSKTAKKVGSDLAEAGAQAAANSAKAATAAVAARNASAKKAAAAE